jgi:hypothetical protein
LINGRGFAPAVIRTFHGEVSEPVSIKLRTASLDDLVIIHAIRRDAILGIPSETGLSDRQTWADRRLPEFYADRLAAGNIVIAGSEGDDIGWGSRADEWIIGKSVRPKEVQEMQAQSAIYNKDRTLMRARAKSGFDVLQQSPMVDPERIAMVGYCFGGTVAVELAGIGVPVVGTVAMHGSFRAHAPEAAKNIKGRFLAQEHG